MIEFPQLTNLENQCLQLFWDYGFPDETKIQEQIRSSKIQREYTKNSISLRFIIDSSVPKASIQLQVPMEVIIEHIKLKAEGTNVDRKSWQIYRTHPPFSIPLESNMQESSPTGFLLHIVDGYVYELEVYNLDPICLQLETLCIGKRIYLLYQ